MRARAQGVTLAIVMELCRFGNLFKVVEYARRVQRLPPDVRAGATPPRALPGPGQARRPRPGPQQGAKLQPARAAARHRLACNSL